MYQMLCSTYTDSSGELCKTDWISGIGTLERKCNSCCCSNQWPRWLQQNSEIYQSYFNWKMDTYNKMWVGNQFWVCRCILLFFNTEYLNYNHLGIKESLKAKHPIAEDPYEITHDIHGVFDGPKTGRIQVMEKVFLLDFFSKTIFILIFLLILLFLGIATVQWIKLLFQQLLPIPTILQEASWKYDNAWWRKNH